jgi:hypothetical protein
LIKKTLPDLSNQKVEVTEPVRVVVEYIRQKPAGKPGTKEGPGNCSPGLEGLEIQRRFYVLW